jgi:predicted negative regulator of RcsB-dependent stress response
MLFTSCTASKKKTAQTEKKDIDVAKQRLKRLLEQQKQERAKQPAKQKLQPGVPPDERERP